MVVPPHAIGSLVLPVVQARAWRRQLVRQRAGDEAIAALTRSGRIRAVESWTSLPTLGDTAVLRVRTAREGDLIVKVAVSTAAGQGLDRHAHLLGHLAGVAAVRRAVPELMVVGDLGRHRYVVERAVPGRPLTGARGRGARAAALRTAAQVHAATAGPPGDATGVVLASVEADLARLGRVCRTATHRRTVDRLARALAAGLDTPGLVTSVVHGDFWSGNVLAVGPADELRSISIVDWERGSLHGLPEVDQVHYLLTEHPVGFSAAVRSWLDAPGTTIGERLADIDVPVLNPRLGSALCAALAWLSHVGAGLDTARRFRAGPLWVRTEVGAVLDTLGGRGGALEDLAERRG